MNRRIWGLLGALLLAVVGTLAIVTYVRGADDRALAGEDVVDVLVVQADIAAGTPAEDLGDLVQAEPVTARLKAEGAVSSVDELEGMVAGAKLVPGEQVVKARFVEASAYQASGGGVTVPDDKLTTTIAVSPERALGGALTPGSYVSVIASFEKDDPAPAQTRSILRRVLVTNVQLAERAAASEDTSSDEDETQVEPGDAPQGQVLVTLAVDPAASEHLVYAAEHGTVWLALDPEKAPQGRTEVVTRENVYR